MKEWGYIRPHLDSNSDEMWGKGQHSGSCSNKGAEHHKKVKLRPLILLNFGDFYLTWRPNVLVVIPLILHKGVRADLIVEVIHVTWIGIDAG